MPRLPADKYVSQVRRPDDIDQFWESVVAETAKVPLEAEVVYDPLRSTETIAVYEVFYNSLDSVRVAGWYARPRESNGLLPGLLQVPGYTMEPPIPKVWAEKGYAAFSVAPRGKLRSNRQFNPGYPGLLTYGIVDRNTYSYRGFYMDACRGLDFLLSLEEVDGDRIGVTGHSQGGGLTVTTAALRPEVVKAAAAGAPYLCGFMDAIELTDGYPYQEIADYLRMNPGSRQQVEDTLAYFDGINLAPRIRCPIIISVGLQDSTCPPETGYATFNAIGSAEKRMYAYDGHGHDANNHRHQAVIDGFLAEHLKP
jgi:cephalosporin-C deacetylase